MPYSSMLHIPLTNLLLLVAKQEPYKKPTLKKKEKKNLERVQETGPTGTHTKKKTERVIGLGRRTRKEIVKWNQMPALRFQTGGETSDIPDIPLGQKKEGCE